MDGEWARHGSGASSAHDERMVADRGRVQFGRVQHAGDVSPDGVSADGGRVADWSLVGNAGNTGCRALKRLAPRCHTVHRPGDARDSAGRDARTVWPNAVDAGRHASGSLSTAGSRADELSGAAPASRRHIQSGSRNAPLTCAMHPNPAHFPLAVHTRPMR